jgi:protein-S-isoprenylcysteine O-methyltransferase Ste14
MRAAVLKELADPNRAVVELREKIAMNDVTERPNSLPWPPIIFLTAIAVSFLLGVFVPFPWFRQPLSGILFAIGWLMIAAFVALNIAAFRVMRRAETTLRPDRGTDHLVTDGPFSFTRNPLYLAGTILILGIGLVSGIGWYLVLAIFAAFAVQKLAIEREEKHLQSRFGKSYLDYAERVRRWI